MLDHRDTHILKSALSGRVGPAAERLSRRLSAGDVDASSLDKDERAEALGALEHFAATAPSFVATAVELARTLRLTGNPRR